MLSFAKMIYRTHTVKIYKTGRCVDMKKIGTIIGGQSVAHEVSIINGLQIFDNIDRSKYDPKIIYIDKQGKWLAGSELEDINNYKNMSFKNTLEVIPWKMDEYKNKLVLVPVKNINRSLFSKKEEEIIIDAVIPAVHGTGVEDGALQGLLQTCSVPYAFSDVKASALGMDKVIMKKVFQSEGLPMVPHIWFYRNDYVNNKIKIIQQCEEIGYPLIIKPANLGSSIGINKAEGLPGLDEAIEIAMEYDKKIIVEKCIENVREINCAVMGYENKVKASLCEEPIGWKDFLRFEDKYMNNTKGKNTEKRVVPADIPEKITVRIRENAKEAFKAIDASGTARIDFLYDGKDIYVNEINTIPGSISFYLWEPSGVEFRELINEMLEIAYKKHSDTVKNINTFDIDLLNNMAKNGKHK